MGRFACLEELCLARNTGIVPKVSEVRQHRNSSTGGGGGGGGSGKGEDGGGKGGDGKTVVGDGKGEEGGGKGDGSNHQAAAFESSFPATLAKALSGSAAKMNSLNLSGLAMWAVDVLPIMTMSLGQLNALARLDLSSCNLHTADHASGTVAVSLSLYLSLSLSLARAPALAFFSLFALN